MSVLVLRLLRAPASACNGRSLGNVGGDCHTDGKMRLLNSRSFRQQIDNFSTQHKIVHWNASFGKYTTPSSNRHLAGAWPILELNEMENCNRISSPFYQTPKF